ncbi:hypothetical protein KSZ_35640 [Dictyobacter formicarum]|uniref:Uncharacterized protein n=1 Tax=Dictyobacter formicarum TaxID=2778368 RepID=A0ABQ3VIA8_9CHLR|nr:hypothetical protein KSZ_35640 [Dictyobacter formicarum]
MEKIGRKVRIYGAHGRRYVGGGDNRTQGPNLFVGDDAEGFGMAYNAFEAGFL